MRLIDADELLARIRLNYNSHQNVSAGAIKDIIDTTATAYDVDKVVKELEQREKTSKECYVEAMTEGSNGSASRFCGEKWAYNNAIKLVRKGGVE